MSRPSHRSLMAVISLLFVLATMAAVPVLAADRRVTMSDNDYKPGVVTIDVGERVTWVNDDDVVHDAVGKGWSTSLLDTNDSDSVRFPRTGRYAYACSIHPEMRGTVVVRGAPAGGPTATTPATDAEASTDEAPTSDPWSWAVGLASFAVAVAGLAGRRFGRRQDSDVP